MPPRCAWGPRRGRRPRKRVGPVLEHRPNVRLDSCSALADRSTPRRVQMNHTSQPNERKTDPGAVNRTAPNSKPRALRHGHPRARASRRFTALGLAVFIALVALSAGCARANGGGPDCTPEIEALPASRASSLIAIVPRTSANAASWGLHELAFLLPFLAQAGLELHVIYTQDSDDLGEGGGDGGPPQVLETQAPSFPTFQVQGAPQAPADPNTLTAKLNCERLAAWQSSANQTLRNQATRRITAVTAWAETNAVRLIALAAKPIPDTTGREAGVEFDAGASIFSAAQVAQAAPRPTILVLGGLTELAPPSQHFAVPAHLVVLVRSTDPTQVLHAENAWSRWITRAGGTFQAISANDGPTAITTALVS